MSSAISSQTSAVSNSDISQKARRAARILDRLPTGVYENVAIVKGEHGWEIRIPGVNNWIIAGDNVKPLWKEQQESDNQ